MDTDQKESPASTDLDKIVERVQKILALGRRGGTEAEAAAAMAKAQQLLMLHNLDMAQVEGAAVGPQAREKVVRSTGMYIYQRRLWNSVAQLNFCLCLRTTVFEKYRGTGKFLHSNKMMVVGRRVNTRATIAMGSYVEQVVDRLCHERLDAHTYYGTLKNKHHAFFSSWAVSFREGVADRIIEKIEDRREKVLKAERKRERELNKKMASGASSSSALTIQVYKDKETDANLDFIHGEGYSAKQAKMKAEIAAELASDEREYAEWAKANPGEARKNAEERRWWRNKGYTYGSRGGASSSRNRNRDWSAYRAGREAGEGVGIDPQAEGSKQGRIGHG